MTEALQERRINRSTNQREALNNLLDYTCLKGGFDQTFIIDEEGELVSFSPSASDAAALAPMAWILKKAMGSLPGAASFETAETILIQTSQGKSMACHFINDRLKGAILATTRGKMPPATEKILATTVESYLRIMAKR